VALKIFLERRDVKRECFQDEENESLSKITSDERLPKRLKCFVAMAFAERETDRLYDRVMAPILDGAIHRAIRVDRIEHNDAIDATNSAEPRSFSTRAVLTS
jgi:hypothetical protein